MTQPSTDRQKLIEDEEDASDFSQYMRYHSETKTYSLQLRWKKLTHMDMVGLAVQLSSKTVRIDTLDLGQTEFDAQGVVGLCNILLTNKTIQSIDLGSNKLGTLGAQRIAEALKRNTTLEFLNLEWNDIGTEGFLALLNGIKANPNSAIRVLDCHSNKIGPEGAIALANMLSKDPPLLSVNLRFNPLGNDGVSALFRCLPHNNHIQAWDFIRSQVGDDALEAFRIAVQSGNRALSEFPKFHATDNPLSVIPENSQPPSDGMQNLLYPAGQTQFVALFLDGNDITSVGLESLANGLLSLCSPPTPKNQIPNRYSISQLSLYQNRTIARAGPVPQVEGLKVLNRVLLNEFCCLKHLDLGGCELEDAGVQCLCESLIAAPTLESLSLVKNKLTNMTAHNLLDVLPSNKALRSLDLSHNLFTELGIPDFFAIGARNTTLEFVDIRGNSFGKEDWDKWVKTHEKDCRPGVIVWRDEKRNIDSASVKENVKVTLYDPTPRKLSKQPSTSRLHLHPNTSTATLPTPNPVSVPKTSAK
ncbi:putative NLR Family CARD Domain Containing protein [Blattamonas nauphoetae]|uniref:NLR Family CARD Domain Containing protein n=1 Tax=Blattamonas nauphoetae TaxID=2049346 RepID=A0ABQ9XCF7_9EUKA|nr:putative NLR Family CARD Domain Containing protein [Blattamonas nauphoetae]